MSKERERELELDFLRIGVIVAKFISLGTNPVVGEWWIIGFSKIAIGLVTCLNMANLYKYMYLCLY